MCVNHLNNPSPYLMLQVCCNDAGVHAHYHEKPNSIACGTISIPKGLGCRIDTASTGVSHLLRVAGNCIRYRKIDDKVAEPLIF